MITPLLIPPVLQNKANLSHNCCHNLQQALPKDACISRKLPRRPHPEDPEREPGSPERGPNKEKKRSTAFTDKSSGYPAKKAALGPRDSKDRLEYFRFH